MPYHVHIIPTRTDNYTFFLIKNDTQDVLIVDPGESKKALDYIQAEKLNVQGILLTHHHKDHLDGVRAIVGEHKAPVICSNFDASRIKFATRAVDFDEHIEAGSFKLQTMDLRGHTMGLVGYFHPESKSLFCGDAVFSLGCGRMFEGTPDLFTESLKKVTVLPDNTNIFCTHEYTLANLNFCSSLETSDLLDLDNAKQTIETRLQEFGRSVPTTVEFEKRHNPFLKVFDPEFLLALKKESPSEGFAYLRTLKDNF
jgi:hydroxyacylglutathione hydrolase